MTFLRLLFMRNPQRAKRFFEILIPLISWAIITLPLWLSFRHPAVASYLIVLFMVYWFYKSAIVAYHGLKSYLTLRAHMQVDWLLLAKKQKGFNDIHNLVIIPEYKEPIHVLRQTLEYIKNQDFPAKKISICIATEVRDSEAPEIIRTLKNEFAHHFAHFWISKHRLVPGEIAGKSSNTAHGARYSVEQFNKIGKSLDAITVTSCDADALLHPKFFSYLSYLFLTDTDHDYHFYQAGVMYYSNIWKVPLPVRVLSTIGSVFSLSNLSQEQRLINFSTYSISLKTVVEVGYWSVDIIPEDYHMFFKTFYSKGEKVMVKPIFLPTLVQAAQSTSFWRTMVNQYEQQKRWAWGVSDIPHVIYNYVVDVKIPFWAKTMRLIHLVEWHVVSATNWFILTLGAFIPPLVNENFSRTNLGHNLSQISSYILTLCVVFILVIIVLDAKVKPERPKEFSRWRIPFLYMQWITLPVISFFLSALPGLDAHTRLMLGKRLEYRVTEKV